MREVPPEYWTRMCVEFLGASGRLSGELWQSYLALYPAQAHAMQFALAKLTFQAAPAPLEIVKQRLRHASTMLQPSILLAVSDALSPPGVDRLRRRDVIRFEEAVLRVTDRDGGWV